MALFGSPNHVSGRDAQDDLLELVWPGLGSDPNENMHMHRDRSYQKVCDTLVDALAADEICAWTDKPSQSDAIKVPRSYWDTDLAKFYFYSGDIETGPETKNPDLESYYTRPWYLLRSDFEQFKYRLMNGGPGQYVSLMDALNYVAAGGANLAAVMRWQCTIHLQCRHDPVLEKYKAEHSAQLEVALGKLNAAWTSGILRPLGRPRPGTNAVEDFVPQQLADVCEFIPLGAGDGSRIQPKDEMDMTPGRSWSHVRFLRRDVEMLLPAAAVADPMSETHWTTPQCIAWVASRSESSVARATNDDGLRAMSGAWAVAGKGYANAKREVLREFRKGLTCLARQRVTGIAANIPMEERAHTEFDVDHNAAYIDNEIRWHDLRFPVAEVLKIWPSLEPAEAPPAPLPQKQQTQVSRAKAKRALTEYRATLNGKLPLSQGELRDLIHGQVGYMAEKPFRELLREIDDERKPGEPALIRGRGKSGAAKSAS